MKTGGSALSRSRSPAAASLALVAALAVSPGAASAADLWTEIGSGAVAILPMPLKAEGITSASLVCAEQRWRFFFSAGPNAVPSGWTGLARLTIGATVLEGEAVEAHGSIGMDFPTDHLETLKHGSNLVFTAINGAVDASFALGGSRATIDAVAPRCSQVDMSAYAKVALSETDPAVEPAKALLADEARLFRAATGKRPAYAAATIDLTGERRLLFASLCGSTSYYGLSGCTFSGFASEGPGTEWRPVYSTEGVLLHTDPKISNGGWPNLVTLPLIGGTAPDHWAWNGTEYENVEALVAGDGEDAPPDEGDGG